MRAPSTSTDIVKRRQRREVAIHTQRVLILGATGDLALRFLLPGLAMLLDGPEAPPVVEVTAVGRAPLDEDAYRALVEEALVARGLGPGPRARMLGCLRWRPAALTGGTADDEALRRAVGHEPVVTYLALPPDVVPTAVAALARVPLAPGSRLAIEKPFGLDGPSARRLEQLLQESLPDVAVARVDHFLFHPIAAAIRAARDAMDGFGPDGRGGRVDSVDIRWHEAHGVRGRADFYDRTGALADMLQSHLLQLLALVVTRPTSDLDDAAAAKAAVLRRLRPLLLTAPGRSTVRARYGRGELGSGVVPAYAETTGVDPDRETETFAALDLWLDDDDWRGVSFHLESGKAIVPPERSVTIRFGDLTARGSEVAKAPSVLRFVMGPEAATVSYRPSDGADHGLSIGAWPPRPEPSPLPASARIFADLLAGRMASFVSAQEVEAAWRLIDEVRASWRRGDPPLVTYPAGSGGPARPPA